MGGLSISPGSRRSEANAPPSVDPAAAETLMMMQKIRTGSASQRIRANRVKMSRPAAHGGRPGHRIPHERVPRSSTGTKWASNAPSCHHEPPADRPKKGAPCQESSCTPPPSFSRGGATDLLRFCSSIRGGVPGDPQKCKAVQIIEAPARCARSNLTLSMPDTRVASSAPLSLCVDRSMPGTAPLALHGHSSVVGAGRRKQGKRGRSKTRTTPTLAGVDCRPAFA